MIIPPVDIDKKFDPSSLKVEVKNTTIEHLVEMLKNDLIDLQPDFQRNADLWGKKKKSLLIESIIMGLPLPSFYFYVDEANKKWVVIDGLQRLCSLRDFMVTKTLSLQDVQFLSKEEYLGKRFGDFSFFEQLNMTMRPVTLNVISGMASVEAMYVIFQRINSCGTQLRPAEIRNALFHGKAMDFVKRLSQSERFLECTNHAVSNKRLQALDYVSRFLAFHIFGYEAYAGYTMDGFIAACMEYVNKNFQDCDYTRLEHEFYDSLSCCVELLGDHVFRNPLTVGKDRISISLFEATLCAVARLDSEQKRALLLNRDKFIRMYKQLFGDKEMEQKLSNGTNSFASVRTRFSKISELVDKRNEFIDKCGKE